MKKTVSSGSSGRQKKKKKKKKTKNEALQLEFKMVPVYYRSQNQNKKVLLRERKRHTARRVASASSPGQGSTPSIPDRGVPHPVLDGGTHPVLGRGYPILSWMGIPPFIPGQRVLPSRPGLGYPPSGPGWGTPSRPGMGYPCPS